MFKDYNNNYVIFRNKVYDMNNFFHPGGNHIITNTLGREISRFLYGAFSLEVIDKN